MADQVSDGPNWLQSIVTLIGGGGLAAVILEVIKRKIPRTSSPEDLTHIYVEKLQEDIRSLQARLDLVERDRDIREKELETELRQERSLNMVQLRTNALLEVENRQLRDRYHRMRNYAQIIVTRAELGDSVPSWVDEQITGPTEHHRALPERTDD